VARIAPVGIRRTFTFNEVVHRCVATPYGAAMVISFVLAVCLVLSPVDGPVIAGFEPSLGYSGHWGVDVAADLGSEVRAPADGVVTFAGQVAGMKSVTIRLGEQVRVSLSYLSSTEVSVGDHVEAGAVVGRSGLAHGEHALHVSVRVGGVYVDPVAYLSCPRGTIRLLPDR
jgi:murein DD-endopeptidase MepM/ murein hydrolase activator NlpD